MHAEALLPQKTPTPHMDFWGTQNLPKTSTNKTSKFLEKRSGTHQKLKTSKTSQKYQQTNLKILEKLTKKFHMLINFY